MVVWEVKFRTAPSHSTHQSPGEVVVVVVVVDAVDELLLVVDAVDEVDEVDDVLVEDAIGYLQGPQ